MKLATKTKKLSNDEVLQLTFLLKKIKNFNDLSKEYEMAKESVANIANSIDLSTQDSIRQIREAKNISNTMKKFLESQKVNVGKRKLAEDSKRAVKRAKIETKNMEKEVNTSLRVLLRRICVPGRVQLTIQIRVHPRGALNLRRSLNSH